MASIKREPCSVCGRERLVWARRAGAPLCKHCLALAKAEPCSACGFVKAVAARVDGLPLCAACRERSVPERLYGRYQASAAKRGLEWDLSLEKFSCLISQPCAWCGEKGGGVDRIDNKAGYIWDNCMPCCPRCNHMRGALTVDAFLDTVEMISRRMR
jgi:hypothetical protein